MRRIVIALTLALVAGVPQAFACVISCMELQSTAVAGHHGHDQHVSHRASPAVAEVSIEATAHDCDRADQLPRLAEPGSKAKAPQTMVASIIPLDAPSISSPTGFLLVAQRPPGSHTLSTQLRI